MIEVGNAIVSEDIFEKEFVCNLSACKGACCVEGDAGAPLLDKEVEILDQIYEEVKPYLRPEGVKAIEKQGTAIQDWDKEYVTPLVNDKECAYVIFENGITKCGIEKAYEAGKIDYKKPISCHLYPIRITSYQSFDAVNYHKWEICQDACALGKELSVHVYQFLKAPLIRHYGPDWYEELNQVAEAWKNKP